MTSGDMKPIVLFDYGCPYSYRAHRWFDAAGAEVDFQPFSLAEVHRTPGDLPVWQVPIERLEPIVLSLAGHELVRESDGDLDGYRRQMFAFWHEETHRTLDGLVEILTTFIGETPTPRILSRGLAAAKASHQSAAAAGVFGTPTLRFGDEPGMFVKLDDLPPDNDAARDLWQHLAAMAHGHQALVELKRANK